MGPWLMRVFETALPIFITMVITIVVAQSMENLWYWFRRK